MITGSIVTYNTSVEELDRVMECIRKSTIKKLYIVDNSPNDSLRYYFSDCPDIVYIHNDNLGYGAGHNIAIKLAMKEGSEYHAVLNSDIYWTEDIFGEMARYMDVHPDVGQMMPKVFYPDGRIQYLCKMLPTPIDLLLRRFGKGKIGEKRLDRFHLKFTGYDKIINVPYLSGCFMFFRIKALQEVGLFDERYFMYPEDVDLTRRVHRKYKTLFYPKVSIVHAHAAAHRTNWKMLKIFIVNMSKYFNKWGWIWDKERKNINKRLLESLAQ